MQSGMNQMNNNPFTGLEEKLSRMLKPVTPDPVFLDALKTKLSRTPSILLESSKKHISLLVVGAGLFAGALAVWIIGMLKRNKK